ncbi:MAG TPA: type II CAAX endopeptidase family protein [Candidatus Polarisedimenticolaceae bacterium]
MDDGPRWGRGWVSLGLWLGLESLLFGGIVLAAVVFPNRETLLAAAAAPEVGAWFVLGPHVLGLGWLVATERGRLASRLRPSGRNLGWGVGGAVAMILAGGAWSWLLEAAGVKLPDTAAYLRGVVPSPAVLLLWGACLVPFVEESWFRGRFLEAVRSRLDVRWAYLMTSVLFSAVHGIVELLPAYFVLATILFVLRERTGGLFAPIVAHALNNLWGLVVS